MAVPCLSVLLCGTVKLLRPQRELRVSLVCFRSENPDQVVEWRKFTHQGFPQDEGGRHRHWDKQPGETQGWSHRRLLFKPFLLSCSLLMPQSSEPGVCAGTLMMHLVK